MSKVILHKIIDKIGSRITTSGFLKNYIIKEGDIVIDAGAYYGYFTIYASQKVGPSGKIIAFEPDPKNFDILQKNVDSYKLKNVILFQKALFNEKNQIVLNSNHSLSSIIGTESSSNSYPVECVKLDEIIDELGIKKIDFIKMDLEGAELEVIDGGKDTIANTSNIAIACYHNRNNKTTGEIMKPILEQIGFKVKFGFFLHPTLYGIKKLT